MSRTCVKLDMPAPPLVVLDTNVFVSALLGKGAPARLYQAFTQGAFKLVSSKELIAELAEVLLRPELAIPPFDIKEAFRLIRRHALIIRVSHHVDVCRESIGVRA